MGCTIRYEYGLFRQRIVDGQQVEVPDEWLTYGNAWEIPTQRDAVEVCFGGQMVENWVGGTNYVTLKNTENVIAVPYDLPIVGYDSDVVDRRRTSTLKNSPRAITTAPRRTATPSRRRFPRCSIRRTTPITARSCA